MSNLMDYGAIGGASLPGTLSNDEKYTQVYQATHDGADRLPYMNRSFISFSFSNKGEERIYIEDFNLIATISNNRLDRSGYSSFNDSTTQYDNLDGQYYWGTHYKTNTIVFKLATDGMDQKQLDKFLHWFSAGVSRELILSEHPNRAQMARVSEPPQLALLPFEGHTTMNISGYEYPITTTLYKGEITLKLVMDEPHWYALDNILGKEIEREDHTHQYINEWTDANGNSVKIFESKDALKILYEDGIPLGSIINNDMLLGNGAYASVEDKPEIRIWNPNPTAEHPLGTARISGTITDSDVTVQMTVAEYFTAKAVAQLGDGATEEQIAALAAQLQEADTKYKGHTNVYPNGTYVGKVAGAIIDSDGNGVSSLGQNTYAYFYYSGTAPSPAILIFTFKPMEDNSISYVTSPANKYVSALKPYNTIRVGSVTEKQLHFTTSNILTSYNTAIDIITTDTNNNTSYEDIRKHLREQIRHQFVRQWAIKIINYVEQKTTGVAEPPTYDAATLCTFMSYFLKNKDGEVYPVTCSFNSKNGESRGWFYYRTTDENFPANDAAWAIYGLPKDQQDNIIDPSKVEEDIGDMIRSNYLIIKERNYPTANGQIVKWERNHKEYSHYIIHDFDTSLTNLSIIYKNMYL